MKLTKSQLEFFFDEILGELGWCDEIEETTVDPIDYVRDEINGLRRHIKRLEKSIELRDAATKTGSIYCWFFENVTSVIERDYEAQEFAREIISEVRRTYEKLEDAEQGVQPTVLTARHKLVTCPRCLCVHGIDLPAPHSG